MRRLINELVAPTLDDLICDAQRWPRKHGAGTGMSAESIRSHWLCFVERVTLELARLSRENGTLAGRVTDLMEQFADLPAGADDKHAAVFRPVGQLAALALVARRASVDPCMSLLSAEIVVEYRRRERTKPDDKPLPGVWNGISGVGAMANVIAIVINGEMLREGE